MSNLDTANAASAPNTILRTALAILYFVWGSTYLAIKFAVEMIPPFYLNALRFTVAGGALYLVLRLRGKPSPTRLGSGALQRW